MRTPRSRRGRWLAALVAVLGGFTVFLSREQVRVGRELDDVLREGTQLAQVLEQTRTQQQRIAKEISELEAKLESNHVELARHERRQRAIADVLENLKQRPISVAKRPPSPSGPHGDYFPELFDDPEYMQLFTTGWQQLIEIRHAAFFANLQVSPSELDRLRRFLVDAAITREDADGVGAKRQPGDVTERSRDKVQILRQLNAELEARFGSEMAKRLQDYYSASATREKFDALHVRLSYSPEPLRPEQLKRLNEFVGPETVLTPFQLEALRQVQADRQAKRSVGPTPPASTQNP